MLTYLEGARFKLQSALMDIDHKPRGSHPLAPHIQITRDRTGLQQSILKVPLWLKNGEEDHTNQEQPHCNGDTVLDEIDRHIDDEYHVDSTNDALIRNLVIHNNNNNLTNSLTRSKSISELSTGTTVIVQNGKSATLSDQSTADGIAFDRGIADGGSNQPDSDFGKKLN